MILVYQRTVSMMKCGVIQKTCAEWFYKEACLVLEWLNIYYYEICFANFFRTTLGKKKSGKKQEQMYLVSCKWFVSIQHCGFIKIDLTSSSDTKNHLL